MNNKQVSKNQISSNIPATKIRRITTTTATATIMIGGILAALSLAVYFWCAIVNQTVFAEEANGENANLVALVANTNQDYIEFCKWYTTTQQWATGESNNGEFTSNAADSTTVHHKQSNNNTKNNTQLYPLPPFLIKKYIFHPQLALIMYSW